MRLTVGGLFSGIGGLDLGLERAGMTVRWQSEIDPYCSQVLAKHWPDVPNLGDVTNVDWEHVERVELVCGGFPCQPFSVAGAQRGRDDPRHLWPHFRDALRVLRPRYALLENVPGLLTLGFGEVASDLADLGYDFEWDCIPAAAVGAPHLRYRVFVVAYARGEQHEGGSAPYERPVTAELPAHANREGESERSVDALEGRGELVPDAPVTGLEGRVGSTNGHGTLSARSCTAMADPDGVARTTTGTREGRWGTVFGSSEVERVERRRGLQRHTWLVEPDVGRVAHGIPHRVDRLRGLGNAVVPQVAEWIGRQLLEAIQPTNRTEGTL